MSPLISAAGMELHWDAIVACLLCEHDRDGLPLLTGNIFRQAIQDACTEPRFVEQLLGTAHFHSEDDKAIARSNVEPHLRWHAMDLSISPEILLEAPDRQAEIHQRSQVLRDEVVGCIRAWAAISNSTSNRLYALIQEHLTQTLVPALSAWSAADAAMERIITDSVFSP